jgi:hypothetical protein
MKCPTHEQSISDTLKDFFHVGLEVELREKESDCCEL